MITRVWLELLTDSARSQTPIQVSFPTFTWEREGYQINYISEEKMMNAF